MTTQTILQYNGIRLQNVQTLSFIETPINSDAGQYVYTKTELKVLGYVTLARSNGLPNLPNQVNGNLPNHIGVYPNFSSAATASIGASQQLAILKLYLEQPRRRLVYSTMVTGTPVSGDANIGTPHFIVEPAKEAMYTGATPINMLVKNDVKAGPIPGPVSVTHVANNEVWRVEFSVIFHTVPPCIPPAGGYTPTAVEGESLYPHVAIDTQISTTLPLDFNGVQRQLGILSNRWSCHDSIDESTYTTRTYTGQLTLANPNWNPNDFRAITVPPVTPGMQRKSIDYVASEDNLSLKYTVVDHEVTVTAPFPATRIKITHNESVEQGSARASFSIRVMLHGARHASKNDLMQVAMAICEQRLLLEEAIVVNAQASILLERVEFTSEQGSDQEHSVSLVMSGKRHALNNNNEPHGLKLHDVVSRAVCWRPVAKKTGFAGPLFNYNNVLSRGNRQFEEPDIDGGIPAISCIHAKLTSPCSEEFTIEASTPDSTEVEDRLARQLAVYQSVDLYSSDMYGSYETDITIEINDNIANSTTDLRYVSQHKTNMYSHYNISSTYSGSGLNVSLPVAQTSGSVSTDNVMVSIGPRQNTRRIRIEAERIGEPPRLPTPVESFTEAAYGAASASDVVTNSLRNVTVTHLNPLPVADGVSLLYTSQMELEYSQNGKPAKHRFGVPDYINPVVATPDTTNPLTPVAKYSYALGDLYINKIDSPLSWNA